MQFAFGQLEVDEVIAITALHNLASQAVMNKLGMQRDEEIFGHPAVPEEHPAHEHVSYRLQSKV